jgi:hypothetical protein
MNPSPTSSSGTTNSKPSSPPTSPADNNTRRSNAGKPTRAMGKRKLCQERQVYSHDVEPGFSSSVGAACNRVWWAGAAYGSRPFSVNPVPLLRISGGVRAGRRCYKRGAPPELSRGTEAIFAFPRLSTINPQPSTIQELREYKCIYVKNDAEIGNFSNEAVVNCAP